jgi:hypothetical protein
MSFQITCPVINVAIYHTEDILNLPRFFDSIGGYTLTFHPENDGIWDNLHDMRMFAIPSSLGPLVWEDEPSEP